MPNRILKESICTSDTIEKLSPFEETFFYRLIVNCDDYGRMDARPAILKAKLFPLRERLALRDVQNALSKLADTGCVKLYEVEHKPYLYLPTWEVHQRIRSRKGKYPPPEANNSLTIDSNSQQLAATRGDLQQLAATCSNSLTIDSNSLTIDSNLRLESNPIQIQSESKSESQTREDALGGFEGELRQKLEEWLRYKRERRESYKPTGLHSFLVQVQKQRQRYGEQQICALIDECMANGWKGIIWDRLKPAKPQNAVDYSEEALPF